MASAEFYENADKLLSTVRNCEDKRFQLDIDLKNHLNSSNNNKDLKIARLQAQLKSLCENEKRSSDRNKQLLKDIEQVENHLSNLSSRTDRLRKLKKQYNDYIQRVYPDWKAESSKFMEQNGIPVNDVKVVMRSKSPCHRIHSPGHHRSSTPSRCRSPSPIVRDSRKRMSSLERTESSLPNSPERISMDIRASHSVENSADFSSPDSKSQPLNKTPILEEQRSSPKNSPHTSLESSPSQKLPVKVKRESPSQRPELIDSLSLNESRSEYLSSSDRIGQADLTLHGLYRLFDHFEKESVGRTVQNIYGYSPRELTVIEEVIRDANSSGSLNHVSLATVSAVILDQLMLINAGLSQGCLFSDALIKELSKLEHNVTEATVLNRLHEFKAVLWRRLYNHFTFLLNRGFMKIDELTEKFAACLIHSNSRLEDKMVELLKNLLSDISVMDSITEDTTSVASPRMDHIVPPSNPQLISSLGATAGSFYELNTSQENFDLKGSAAYKNLVTSSQDKLQNDSQEDVDSEEEQAKLDALLAFESPSHNKQADVSPGRENKLRSTQELLKSVTHRDSDLDDLSMSDSPLHQSTIKKKTVDYDDDFGDFFD